MYQANAQIVISQYTETSSGTTPKGIEILNTSGADIDLSVTPITVYKGVNGGSLGLDHTVSSGILEDGNVIVIGTSDMALANLTSPCVNALYSEKSFTFNGDDALDIRLDGVIMDVFGTPDVDPGSSWSGNGVSTANQNIQLKSGITTGDLDGWSDPSERFEMVADGSDLTGFGTPTDGCPTSTQTTVSFDESSITYNEDAGTIDACVSIINPSMTNSTTVDIELNVSSSAVNGTDYTDGMSNAISFPVTLTFPANSSTSQCLSISIVDDSDLESTENIDLDLNNVSGGENAQIGSVSSTQITISDNDGPTYTNDDVRINEVDADQTGADFAEFIELYGTPNLVLDGLVVVLFNGSNDASYSAYDLDGYALDANGFLIIGQAGAVSFTPEIELDGNGIQNGADAVALFSGNASDFPTNTPVTDINLIDALVYDTNDSDDSGLSILYTTPNVNYDVDEMIQVNEDENGNSELESIQRGSWFVSLPTPRATNALPVEFASVEVENKGKSNLIEWSTAVEINNEYFAVERSADGRNFTAIGKVDGNGTTFDKSYYTFIDESPAATINYYRIKQVDLDGKYDYSKIVSTNNLSAFTRVFPTNSTDIINIETSSDASSYIVLNSSGQKFMYGNLVKGLNTLSINQLRNGIYFIQITSGDLSYTEKIFKN